MEKNNNEEIEIDLRELFGVLMARIYLIIGVGVIFALAAGLITKLCITPQYQSTSSIYVLTKSTGGSAAENVLTSLSDLQLGSQVLTDYETMITCRPVLEKVIDNLELDMTTKELRSIVSLYNKENTRTLDITITHPDPKIAKEIVDELAGVSVEYCAKIMKVEQPNIFVDGEVATTQTSPNTKKNVAVAGIAGIFLMCVIIIVRYLLDDTIQCQEDVEKYLSLNTLGVIPIEEGSMEQLKKDKKKRKKDMRK